MLTISNYQLSILAVASYGLAKLAIAMGMACYAMGKYALAIVTSMKEIYFQHFDSKTHLCIVNIKTTPLYYLVSVCVRMCVHSALSFFKKTFFF